MSDSNFDPREWQRNMGIDPASNDDLFKAAQDAPGADRGQSEDTRREKPGSQWSFGQDKQGERSDADPRRDTTQDHGQSEKKSGNILSHPLIRDALPRFRPMPQNKILYVVIAIVGGLIGTVFFSIIVAMPLSFIFWPNIMTRWEEGDKQASVKSFVLMFIAAIILAIIYSLIGELFAPTL